jgi:hypothetical protein
VIGFEGEILGAGAIVVGDVILDGAVSEGGVARASGYVEVTRREGRRVDGTGAGIQGVGLCGG